MKPAIKTVRGWGFSAAFVLFVLLFISCKYELVKEPTHNFNEKKNAADYKDYIFPPSSITASQGLSHSVDLEWREVPNAVQYQIFSAATPYDTFQKVSETKANETTISIDEEAGITKYYCVCAVNYYGTVSSKSVVVSGSTLSVPIITEITASEEGTCVTVSWWMDNCNEKTYRDGVYYNIAVYKNASSNVKAQNLTVEGYKHSCVIKDLEPKTEYFFTIEVVNKETGDKEISSKTSAQTAHRVIPDPPENLEVSKGNSISKIIVSWKLPAETWYRTNEGSSGFELHPLYFKIYRREVSQEFTLIAQQKFTDSYVSGITVSYDDTNVVRGKQYEYYVQSYTDNLPAGKEITGDSSKSQVVKGWLISEPKFYIESEYTKSDDERSFTKITFNPKLSFETYGIDYKYVIGIKKVDLDTSTEEDLQPKTFNTVSAVNEYIDSFEDPANEQGYYYYSLYIYPSEGDEYYFAVDASGKYTVTDSVSKIPTINNFVLHDGFSQKFELSWEYNSEYVYIIHWKDGENGEEQTQEIDSSYFAGKTDGQTVSYSHTANSGDCRIYTLEASAGISTIVRPNNDTDEKLYKTLGTPDIKIVSYEFDKIEVEWDAVQMASDTYSISAHYENDNTELVPESLRTKTIPADSDTVSFELTEPEGYNDAAKAGKPIILSVTASSSSQTDSTVGATNVYVLGPALTNTRVSQIDEDVINNALSITWDSVQGAKGYLIKRVCYKKGKTDIDANDSEKDTYYFNGTELYANNEPADSQRAYVTATENGFVLTDIAKEVQDDTKSYEINQSRISWGVPYDYFVIPVKEDGIEPSFPYTNVPNNYIATYGYGLNVKAEKSDSSNTQILEWDPPYITENNYPSFYAREVNSSNNNWKKIKTTSVDGSGKKVSFKPDDSTKAYEYIVAYNKAYDNISIPVSFLNDTDVGLSTLESRNERYSYANEDDREKANKGYLLAVSFSAGTGTGNSEIVTWSAWDYANRKIGPDSAKLYIKNYNISADWKQFAELNSNLQYSNKLDLTNTTITKKDNVSVSLEPTTKMDKDNNLVVTPGYMQVLRDAKHYYKLDLIRGDNTCTVGVDEEGGEKVFAYRDITDKELVKCALLNIAYGFYLDAGGDVNYGSIDSQLKYQEKDSLVFDGIGSASFGERKGCAIFSEEIGKYKADVTMSGFAPNMLNPGGTRTCVVKVSMGPVSTRTKGLDDAYLDKFRTEGFTVKTTLLDDNMPSSYKKEFTMTCTGKGNLTIKIGSETIIQATTEADRCKYFPIQLHDESKWWFKNSTYGWWPQ